MVKNLLVNTGDVCSIPRSGGCPGEENGKLLQHSSDELESIGSQRVEYS